MLRSIIVSLLALVVVFAYPNTTKSSKGNVEVVQAQMPTSGRLQYSQGIDTRVYPLHLIEFNEETGKVTFEATNHNGVTQKLHMILNATLTEAAPWQDGVTERWEVNVSEGKIAMLSAYEAGAENSYKTIVFDSS